MRLLRSFGAVVVCLLLGACGDGFTAVPFTEVSRQSVVGGTQEQGMPFVAAIVPVAPTCGGQDASPEVACTGTLVAPRVVLTAAHCVEGADAAQVLSAVFATETAGALPAERVRAVEARLHPGWSAGKNDIGVLILAEDAPVAPMSLEAVELSTDLVGKPVRVVGFGLDDEGRTGVRRGGTAQVVEVGEESFSLTRAPGMSCNGDSGGPVLLQVDGAERLVGVTSFGDLACTTGGNARVDVHMDFVQAVIDEVARRPPSRPSFDASVDTCVAECEGHSDCAMGMACVSRPGGGKGCAVAGLEAGRFGASCTGPDGTRLCVRAGAECRLWLPCASDAVDTGGGGCGATKANAPASGAFVAVLVLAVRLSWRQRALHN